MSAPNTASRDRLMRRTSVIWENGRESLVTKPKRFDTKLRGTRTVRTDTCRRCVSPASKRDNAPDGVFKHEQPPLDEDAELQGGARIMKKGFVGRYAQRVPHGGPALAVSESEREMQRALQTRSARNDEKRGASAFFFSLLLQRSRTYSVGAVWREPAACVGE